MYIILDIQTPVVVKLFWAKAEAQRKANKHTSFIILEFSEGKMMDMK